MEKQILRTLGHQVQEKYIWQKIISKFLGILRKIQIELDLKHIKTGSGHRCV